MLPRISRRRMLARLSLAGWLGLMGVHGRAQVGSRSIRVLAASDLKFVLARLIAQYAQANGIAVEVTYGSSGNLARQIAQGLPADLFMSADGALVAQLHRQSLTRDAGVVYARGRLALLARSSLQPRPDAELTALGHWLRSPALDFKLAIANPDHAPYGRAAREALQRAGLWDAAQPHLVLGDSVAQATQFVTSGAAHGALTALSLMAAPHMPQSLQHVTVQEQLHTPLLQRMALLRQASAQAQHLYEHLQSPALRVIWASHGFA